MKCGFCGEENLEGASCCKQCGQKFKKSRASITEIEKVKIEPKPLNESFFKSFNTLTTLFFVIAICVYIYYYLNSLYLLVVKALFGIDFSTRDIVGYDLVIVFSMHVLLFIYALFLYPKSRIVYLTIAIPIVIIIIVFLENILYYFWLNILIKAMYNSVNLNNVFCYFFIPELRLIW